MILVLVDENTHEHCLPKFLGEIEAGKRIEILEIESGESNKSIHTCLGLWEALSELGADRKSLMINLGGGVLTDMGGFVASTFKRGMKYINVPTTLLAMVDASVGGKTGVDLNNLKNQVGVINSGDMVLIDTSYLETLPREHIISGMAEMFKHGLISGRSYWNDMIAYPDQEKDRLDELIYESVVIKNKVVTEDPTEQDLRKTLNFGHTLGHAIESYHLEEESKVTLLHGEAIAIGMILESYISHKMLGFPMNIFDELVAVVNKLYDPIHYDAQDQSNIIDLLKFDKKNEHGRINFLLLKDIGNHKIDCQVENDLIREAFQYYHDRTGS